MGVSTFGAFTTARLGIYASQKALEVTGNNISNINTPGYTRQVLNQRSLYIGGTDRYVSSLDLKVGGGALCTGVGQLRDPYLDIRYRNSQTNVGAMDARLGGLQSLANILDEVGKGDGDGVIEKQLSDMISQLGNLAANGAGQDDYDSLVRASATVLAGLFNDYAKELDTLAQEQAMGLQQGVDKVNTLLGNIRELSVSIRNSQIHGGDALELRDERNRCIDELSAYLKINVTYEQEDVGAGFLVEKLVIRLAGNGQGTGSERAALVDGTHAAQLSLLRDGGGAVLPGYPLALGPLTDISGNVRVGKKTDTVIENVTNPDDYADGAVDNGDGSETVTRYTKTLNDDGATYTVKETTFTRSAAVHLGDNDLYGALQSAREILTEKGEYATAADLAADPDAASKRGIPYYRAALDALANKLAAVLNGANTLPDEVIYQIQTEADGNPVLDGDGKPQYVLVDGERVLREEYKNYRGGSLFSSTDGGPVRAGNIAVSQEWATGAVRILQSREPNFTSTDNSNLDYMLYLMTSDQSYAPSDTVAGTGDTVYFTGSFQGMLTNISAVLANDAMTTTARLENYAAAADEVYVERDAVSGVDLNDEAINMMQFQKSYSAACRLMTTLDEVLDKLINGTGRTGL